MDTTDRKRWVRAVLLVGVLYGAIGIAFSAFGRWTAFNAEPPTWNRLAFLASAIVFVVHVGYEQFRLRSSPQITAVHAALAVSLGAFLVALAANIHELGSASGFRLRMLLALPAWPVMTLVPSLVAAWVVAAGLNLTRRRA